MNPDNYALISKNLYRVQKFSVKDYYFRHHLETTVDDKYNGVKNETISIKMGKMIRIASLKSLIENNPHKVHINITGKITEI
jgi:CRISPR-associated endonuclease Csn1